MAITILEQPAFISPTGNPMLFKIGDTDPEVTFFRATINEVGTSRVLGQMKIFKTPTSDGNFVDVSKRLDDFVSIDIDNVSDLYRGITGAIQYNVTFESFDFEAELLDTETTTDMWAFSGGGDVLSGYNYDVTDWYVNEAQIGVKYADFLTGKPHINNVYVFQKDFLYFLADSNSGVEGVEFNFTFKDGSTLTEKEVINLDTDTILHRIYTQPNLLSTTYDFDVSTLHSFTVHLYGADDVRITQQRTFVIDEAYDCNVDKVNILWENYEGGIDSFTFINPKETKRVNRQTMSLNGYSEEVGNVYQNLSQVVSTSLESTYSLTTLSLSDDIYRTLSNIIGTKNAYVELGNGSLWGIVIGNTSVDVKRRKYETSLLRFPLTFTSLPNMDIINRGIVLIAPDANPNPLNFNDVSEADFLTQYTSNTQTIAGINVTVPVTISGGQYRINNGVWTSGSSIANNGDTITLRLTTTSAGETPHTATVNVGDGTFSWTVTTKEVFDIPDVVTFTSQTGTDLNVNITSNLVTISGINVPIPISVSNGLYSKNGGGYTSGNTTAVEGDTFRVRHTSANAGLTPTTTTFNYGGLQATFTSTTKEYDITPDDFSFTTLNNQTPSTQVMSNIITVSGITESVPISVSNAQYQINGGSWVSSAGSVSNGDTVRLRLTTPANYGQSIVANLVISNKNANWSVNTIPADTTPNDFNFTSQTNREPSVIVNSNIVTITGINVPVPVEITSGSSYTQYQINGGAWVNTINNITSGQTLRIRMTTSPNYNTSRSATIKVGSLSKTWTTTTRNNLVTATLCSVTENIQLGHIRAEARLSQPASTAVTLNCTLHYIDQVGNEQGVGFTITLSAGMTMQGTGLLATDARQLQGVGFPNITVNSSTPANNASIATPTGTATFQRPTGAAYAICFF